MTRYGVSWAKRQDGDAPLVPAREPQGRTAISDSPRLTLDASTTERVFRFAVAAKIVPAVRMTRRSKFVNPQAARYLAYKELIGWTARQRGAEIMHGPIALSVTAFAFRRKFDATNVLKGVEDALNGVCWEDDKAIVDASIRVFGCESADVETLCVEVAGQRELPSSITKGANHEPHS